MGIIELGSLAFFSYQNLTGIYNLSLQNNGYYSGITYRIMLFSARILKVDLIGNI